MSDDLQEDGQTEPRRNKTMNKGDKQKFRDPLMNTAGNESDEGEVGTYFATLAISFYNVLSV